MTRRSRNCCCARRAWGYVLLTLALPFCGMLAFAGSPNNPCDAANDIPDVIVGEIFSDNGGDTMNRYGPVGGITAYSFGTYSCNIGSCWLDWCDDPSCGAGATFDGPTRHPVISQNLFRLKGGKFEQIGQAWLKHGFFALSDEVCDTGCGNVPDGDHLGVNCSDPYDAALNGQQGGMGPKDQVNAAKGEFLWPYRAQGQTGQAIYKRLQVHTPDVTPSSNPGALYFAEANYTTPDDAPLRDTNDDFTNNGVDDFDVRDNSANNSSYRQVVASGTTNITLTFSGATVREDPAIKAWKVNDPAVFIDEVVVPSDGRYWIASRATDLGGGLWHYEYAVLNHSSHRSARSFSVPLPFGANVFNLGFHDVDYHSENTNGTGSFYDGTDWPNNGGDDFAVTWATQTQAENVNANALRWNTLYNFRFDADVPPISPNGLATIELFVPAGLTSFTAKVMAPSLCDSDAVCDNLENASNCPNDCNNQGGGGGQCGDTVCNLGESPCSCVRDCGAAPSTEFICNDGRDDDCDAQSDCPDNDCCSALTCGGADNDGDTFEACDCDDTDDQVWSRPSEVQDLLLSKVAGTTLDWTAPQEPGAVSITYEVLRSANPTNFLTSTQCMVDPDPSDTTALDNSGNPPPGAAFFYEVRAQNSCPQGEGVLGRDSNNIPRQGRSCP